MASIIGVSPSACTSWAMGAATELAGAALGAGPVAASTVTRVSASRPEARQLGQMLDLALRYLYRFSLRGTVASSSAVYSSIVKPHLAQQSLIFSIVGGGFRWFGAPVGTGEEISMRRAADTQVRS